MQKPLKVMDYKIVDNDTLKVHWYAADTKFNNPTGAIAFFFGGGWRGGSYTHFKRQALYFSQRGLATFLFDYRVETRQNTSPVACIKDARSALRFLKKNHLKFNIDPEKIISSGGSAGGHIAAGTGTLQLINESTDDLSIDPTPFAMVLFNPVFDNGPNGYHGSGSKELIEEDFHCYCKSYTLPNGKWATLFKSRYLELSPFHNITALTPPTLIMFGDDDHLVPVETAYEFQTKMKDKGNRCQVLIYNGAKHGFFNGVESKVNEENASQAKYFFDTLQASDDFLVDLKLLESSANVKDYFE
jgi:acetyl esterase